MAEFQRYQEAPQFNPMAIVEAGERVQKQGQQIVDALQTYQGQTVQRDQNRIEDARFNQSAEVLKAFGSLSQTAADTVKTIEQQNAKNREIDAQWRALYGAEEIPAEEGAVLEAGQRQQMTAGAAANRLEAEGDELGAQALRQDLNRIGQGVADEKALLMDARTAYPSEVLTIINSDPELAKLYNSNPAQALQLATRKFIENRGLQYTTKTQFVNTLAQTIRQTNSYLAQGQTTALIKEQQGNRRAETLSNVYYTGQITTPDTAAIDFQMLSRQLLEDNNGILTRGAANREAAKALLAGAASVSDDQIDVVAAIPVNPAQPNTTVGRTYATDVQTARENYQLLRGKQQRAFRQETESTLIQAISDENLDPATRAARIEQAAQILEAQGDFIGAEALRQKTGSYAVDPQANRNFVTQQQQIAAGDIVPTDQQLNEQVASGQLSPTAANSLRTQRDQRFKEVRETSKAVVNSNLSRVNSQLKIVSRQEFDPTTGSFRVSASGQSPLDKGVTKAFYNDYKAALQQDLRDYSLTLDPNDPVSVNDEKLRQRADQFYQNETQSPGGRFWMGGLFTMPAKVDPGTDEFEQIANAGRSYGSQGLEPVRQGATDWSADWDPGEGVNSRIAQNFKPGDILYTQQEAERAQAQITNDSANFPTSVIQAAQDLNMNPLDFLNTQLTFYGYNELTGGKFPSASAGDPAKPTFVTEQGRSALSQALTAGYSTRGSALLAALVIQGSRENLTDGFFGLGRQGQSMITEGWIERMTTSLTLEEQKLITNPNATDRQIFTLIPGEDRAEVEAIYKKLMQLVGY